MLPPVLQLRPAKITKSVRYTSDLFCLTVEVSPEDRFSFTAGQWVYLHLLDESGKSLAKGAFSIASEPTETGTTFEFFVKVYGRLTQTFGELPVGSVIALQGPFGLFVLPASPEVPILCIAGGIGVTPFRSFLRAAAQTGRTEPFYLIWMSKTEAELFCREEFDQLAKEYSWFKPIYSITRGANSLWTEKIGRLSAEWLNELALDWSKTQIFSCGPLAMMHEAKQLVLERGIEAKQWHQERFD